VNAQHPLKSNRRTACAIATGYAGSISALSFSHGITLFI
jgi:hypothetical protein